MGDINTFSKFSFENLEVYKEARSLVKQIYTCMSLASFFMQA